MRERVNPRVNRDLPEQELPLAKDSDTAGRTLSMVDLTTSPGWTEVVVANLERRRRSIEHRLATDQRLETGEIRRLQAQHELMGQMVDDPKGFFTSDPGAV